MQREDVERVWIDDERPIGGSVHVFNEDSEGARTYATEYVRADLYAALLDRAEKAEAELAKLRADGCAEAGLREALRRLLTEAELDGMESRAGWDCWMHQAREALGDAPVVVHEAPVHEQQTGLTHSDETQAIYHAEEAGRLTNHCSDDSGLPDVGKSLGLGDGQMLFVGDAPDCKGTALVIYGPHDRTVIAQPCDREAGYEMLDALAAIIRRLQGQVW